jgi:hypothetical protein
MAMAMELMAEVVQHSWPEWQVTSMRSLRLLRGVVLDHGAKTVRIVARPQVQSVDGGDFSVDVEIQELESSLPASYRATVQLADRLTAAPADRVPTLSDLRPFEIDPADAYRRWLFHGPLFQRLLTIEGTNGPWISALVSPSSPTQCMIDADDSQWLIDPVVIDCGFQLAILWSRVHNDMTPLPMKLKAYRRLGVPSGGPLRCHMHAESSGGGITLLNQFYFSELDGRLVSVIEDMEGTCSKALNRLGGTTVGEVVR